MLFIKYWTCVILLALITIIFYIPSWIIELIRIAAAKLTLAMCDLDDRRQS